MALLVLVEGSAVVADFAVSAVVAVVAAEDAAVVVGQFDFVAAPAVSVHDVVAAESELAELDG